jgi:Glycosyltransferase sugar-binding region containing DXD motif
MLENNNVFQIYLSDKEGEIPPLISLATESILNGLNGYKHHILKNEELRTMIKDNFDLETLRSYDSLVPYAYKADLGRYCLLHKFGGWYFDISITLNQLIPRVDGVKNVIFKDAPNPGLSSWNCSNSILFAEAGDKIYENIIKQINKNCSEKYYGTNSLCPTGPSLLGQMFAIHGPEQTTITGMLLPLTPHHSIKNYAFILPDGRIFAWGKKTWGTNAGDGLGGLGAEGTNSYSELYALKRIYSNDLA